MSRLIKDSELSGMDMIEIACADNGFVMRYKDMEVVAKNRTSDGWQDPWRQRVYETPEALTADLAKVLPLMREYKEEQSEQVEFADAIAEAFKSTET